ncbi:MAG: hypothetical protein RR651_00305 [Lysinibacillus sp.]
MRRFRTLKQATEDRQELQTYIDLIESYSPKNFTEHVIQLYVQLGNIKVTASVLNDEGYQVANRSMAGKDVTKIILSEPDPNDLLHQEVKRLYIQRNTRRDKDRELKEYFHRL